MVKIGFYVTAHIKKTGGSPLCSLPNKADIASPAGGSPSNLFPGNDSASATAANLDPARLAPQPHTDLKERPRPVAVRSFTWNDVSLTGT